MADSASFGVDDVEDVTEFELDLTIVLPTPAAGSVIGARAAGVEIDRSEARIVGTTGTVVAISTGACPVTFT